MISQMISHNKLRTPYLFQCNSKILNHLNLTESKRCDCTCVETFVIAAATFIYAISWSFCNGATENHEEDAAKSLFMLWKRIC